MRDYGSVSPRFWTQGTGKALRGDTDAQLLALYLMTSPHSTALGIFHCPVLYIAHETGLSIDGASKGIQRLIEGGFCEYDEASEVVFVVQMARYQIAESLQQRDKRVSWLRKEIEKLSNHWKTRFLAVHGVAFSLIDESEIPSPSEAPSKPHRSQDQDQDQDQDQEQEQEQEQDASPPAPPTQAKGRGRKVSEPISEPPPDGLDADAWARWLTYRVEIRKPIKPVSIPAAQRKLAGFGCDQAAVVEQSIANSWQGLFAPKDRPNGNAVNGAHRESRFDALMRESRARQVFDTDGNPLDEDGNVIPY